MARCRSAPSTLPSSFRTGGDRRIVYDGSAIVDLGAWQAGHRQDRNSVFADPLFVNRSAHDYRLQVPGSPAISAGGETGLLADHDGNPRSVPLDIGAFETD